MDQRQRARWAWALAAGVFLLMVVVVLRVFPARQPASPERAPQGEELAGPAPSPPPAPLPPPPLRRVDLVAAAARAAAAYAAGEPYPAADQALVGRRFEFVLPFGCTGPSSSPTTEPARWNFDLKSRTITLTAQPQIWTDTPWVREAIGAEEGAAVEGFWLPRPWLAAERCPAPRSPSAGAPAPQASEPTVGMAQVFGADTSRLEQRGERPYQVVRKATEEDLATTARAYNLVLTGRITGFAGGTPVRCWSDSVDRRPACLIGAQVDAVSFVDPATRDVLADWRG